MLKISLDRREAEALLGRLATIGKDLDPVKQAARFVRAQIAQGFVDQRDPYGNSWKPLADATLKLRMRAGNSSTQILDDSGEMRRSLRVRDDTVTIRTPAEFHQTGGPMIMFGKHRAWLPQRRIMPINDQGQADLPEAWADVIAGYFTDWIGRQ